LEHHLTNDDSLTFDASKIRKVLYRPFVSYENYFDRIVTHRIYQNDQIFPISSQVENRTIAFLSIVSAWPLACLASDRLFDYCLLKQGNGATQSVSRWCFGSDGTRIDNITDWAVERFHARYQQGDKLKRPISKDAIFNYVYGVLHDPIYREKYKQNLKRELPRIPFYADFWKWAEWGETLMRLHLDYEGAAPWKLQRVDLPDEKSKSAKLAPKPTLKADKESGVIVLDSATQLTRIPPKAWAYKLGNRSALEWILDQYKEKTPKDPTIREKFNTYRFADHKEKVIDLLMRVTRVSVETMEIVEAMRKEKR
jgi:predicted helicase